MKKIILRFNFLALVVILYLPKNLFSQNVGIGTPTPPTRAKLEVYGDAGGTSAIFGGESTGISLRANWPAIGFNEYYNSSLGNKYIANGFAANLYLNTSNGMMGYLMIPSGTTNATIPGYTQALMISNNGNIGIRTNPANASLYVTKAGNFDGSAIFGGTHYNSHFHYSGTEDTYIRAGKSGGSVYINDVPNGKILIGAGATYVGINTATPVVTLEIRQTGLTGMVLVEPAETFNNWEHVVGFWNGGPQSSLKMIYNGQFKSYWRPTDGEIIAISDKRLKTNIRALPFLLDKILQLRPVEYQMKYDNPGHEKSIGFIAQEVKKIFPEMVTVSINTVAKGVIIPDFHALDYNAFKIIAVKGVQEEQKLIQDLQSRQTEISRRLEDIEKKLTGKN